MTRCFKKIRNQSSVVPRFVPTAGEVRFGHFSSFRKLSRRTVPLTMMDYRSSHSAANNVSNRISIRYQNEAPFQNEGGCPEDFAFSVTPPRKIPLVDSQQRSPPCLRKHGRSKDCMVTRSETSRSKLSPPFRTGSALDGFFLATPEDVGMASSESSFDLDSDREANANDVDVSSRGSKDAIGTHQEDFKEKSHRLDDSSSPKSFRPIQVDEDEFFCSDFGKTGEPPSSRWQRRKASGYLLLPKQSRGSFLSERDYFDGWGTATRTPEVTHWPSRRNVVKETDVFP